MADKYPAVKALLEIPEDEPIFILRAQDRLSSGTIRGYIERYAAIPDEDYGDGLEDAAGFIDHLGEIETVFTHWQRDNADRVKIPD